MNSAIENLKTFLTSGAWVYNEKAFTGAAAHLKAIKLELIKNHSANPEIITSFNEVESAFMGMFEMLVSKDFDTLSDQQDDTYKYLCYLETVLTPAPAKEGQPF